MASSEKCTHYLVPDVHAAKLRALAKSSKIEQSVHLRAAVHLLLRRYLGMPAPARWPEMPEDAHNVSLVFRLPAEDLEGMKALEADTRIRRSVWFRRGLLEYLEPTDAKGNQALGAEAAERIREALAMGYSVESQAKLYGVAHSTVARIRDGLTYKAQAGAEAGR